PARHPSQHSHACPYTPLFRSRSDGPRVLANAVARAGEAEPARALLPRFANGAARSAVRRVRREVYAHAFAEQLPFRAAACPLVADRKSTRLNSSHVKTSYAVI